MDVVGLALGVLPVLSCAVTQYGKLYKAFKRFRKCGDEVQTLLQCLDMQKIIFMNETQLLLIPAIGFRKAEDMVHDTSNPGWTDQATEAAIHRLLGNSKDATLLAAQMINKKLEIMEKEIRGLDVADTKRGDLGHKDLHKLLRKKFKYAFSEERLSKLGTSIKEATDCYRQLRAQVQEVASLRPDRQDSAASPEQIQRFELTRKAAERVYKLLATACTIHEDHQAHFSLRPSVGQPGPSLDCCFKIAYHEHVRRPEKADPLWFVIETTRGELTGNTPATDFFGASRDALPKRSASPSILPELNRSVKSQIKRVRFDVDLPKDSVTPTSLEAVLTNSFLHNTPELPDLGSTRSFCTRLRGCRSRGEPEENQMCIGFLNDAEPWKHLVYRIAGPNVTAATIDNTLEPLLGLLIGSQPSARKMPCLTILQRIQLAKLLSAAVLNFHETPWLQSCDTRDIFLFRSQYSQREDLKSHTEPEAFIQVPVRCTDEVTAACFSKDEEPFVHNATMYKLGVILLELAFERPLRSMVYEDEIAPRSSQVMLDIRTAFRRARDPSALGITYSKIVQKCLHCDFGYGSDLRSPALQGKIYQEVIVELDRLEKGLQQLGING